MPTAKEKAGAIGQEHGKNGAAWVIDGNTTATACARLLKGIQEGDPEVMDAYNPPNLSGEYADQYTEGDLANDVMDGDGCSECGHSLTAPLGECECCDCHAEVMSELCAAYDGAAGEAFWHELERLATAGLGVCKYSAKHMTDDVPATTAIKCGPVGIVAACQACADFYKRMAVR